MIRTNMTAGAALSINAERYPEKLALVVDGVSRTYRNLNQRVNQLAHGLIEMGIRKGDRVGIISANSVPWVEVLYALCKIGGVVVPINYRVLDREILEELGRYGVKAVFISRDFLHVAREYRERMGENAICVLLEGGAAGGIHTLDGMTEGRPYDEPKVNLGREDPALIMFTGGTTGTPKGALCSHEMLAWITVNYMVEYDTPRTDHIMVHPYPLFHASGMYRLISYIWAGATYLTMGVYDTRACLELIETYRANVFIGSSAVFVPMLELRRKERYDTGSVNLVCATFAFMDREGRRQLEELFPNARIYVGYGFTEGGAIAALRPEQEPREPGSVGRPAVFTELRIVDESGRTLPPGEVGEIQVRGPHVSMGYVQNPEETALSFGNGWFSSGDMGKLDQDGFLYIVDRKKDMIKTGGENVYSREVEEVILGHPEIREAAVIGIPHNRWGETIRAVVVKEEHSSLTEQDLIDYCRNHLAGYKKPTSVVFVQEIPKTETGGKISKRKLKEVYGRP